MRGLLACAAGALAMATIGGDAVAGTYPQRMGAVVLHSTSDSASSTTLAPRTVSPGQMVMITGDCVEESDKISVVLALADPEPRAGWHAMLVTDMEMQDGNLHVRVPNIAEARNHTFRVRLYVGESENACVCEAGQIRIG
jgi:hypothetical protein